MERRLIDGTVAVLPNELALAARATAEPTAFAAIYDHYFPRVYNYVRYRVRDANSRGLTDDVRAPQSAGTCAKSGFGVESRTWIPTPWRSSG